MNIVICEDNTADGNLLRFHVSRFFQERNCSCQISVYPSGEAFLKARSARKIQDVIILFLDIYMFEINGVEVAKKVRETDKETVIVFTTTSQTHALDGYSVNALQYLRKPIDYPEVEEVLQKCAKQYADSLRFIDVLSDRLTVRVYLKDILYMEVYGKAVSVHTQTETIKCYTPISELEKQLEDDTFLRTHRSYIVNMRYIDDMAANDFIMKNGAIIPIRVNDKLAVKQAYRNYLSALRRGI